MPWKSSRVTDIVDTQTGKVLIGLDWGLTSSGGVFSPDAVYVLQTTDGANIMVTEKGHAPFVQILFETASTKYAWLNSAVGISTGAPFDGGVALDVWQVSIWMQRYLMRPSPCSSILTCLRWASKHSLGFGSMG